MRIVLDRTRIFVFLQYDPGMQLMFVSLWNLVGGASCSSQPLLLAGNMNQHHSMQKPGNSAVNTQHGHHCRQSLLASMLKIKPGVKIPLCSNSPSLVSTSMVHQNGRLVKLSAWWLPVYETIRLLCSWLSASHRKADELSHRSSERNHDQIQGQCHSVASLHQAHKSRSCQSHCYHET
jgi:hypothetical protein